MITSSHRDYMDAVLISGPSGVGKSTLTSGLAADRVCLSRVVTHTTRPPRPGEVDGQDYHFVTLDRFETLEKRALFLDVTSVNDHYYGLTMTSIAQVSETGRLALIAVDPAGGARIMRSLRCLSIFLVAPVAILGTPPRSWNDATEIENRLARYEFDLQLSSKFDFVVRSLDKEQVLLDVRRLMFEAMLDGGQPL